MIKIAILYIIILSVILMFNHGAHSINPEDPSEYNR